MKAKRLSQIIFVAFGLEKIIVSYMKLSAMEKGITLLMSLMMLLDEEMQQKRRSHTIVFGRYLIEIVFPRIDSIMQLQRHKLMGSK